jgi:hypothetical protein
MRAVTLHQTPDQVRIVDREPPADARERLVPVVAAALNPVDVAIAAGKLAFRQLPEGAALGFEGVAQHEPGRYVYFSAPGHPGDRWPTRLTSPTPRWSPCRTAWLRPRLRPSAYPVSPPIWP